MFAVTQCRDCAGKLVVIDAELVMPEDFIDALLLFGVGFDPVLRQVHAHQFKS